PSPLDRVREARVSGLEIREFEKGLSEGGNGTNPNSKPVQLDPNTVIQAKATIVNALAANHTPEEIAVYLEKISPFLDTAMLANNQSKAHEQQLAMYERLLDERNQQPSLISHIQEVKELQNVLGIGPKSEAVQAKELDISFQKWQAELNAQSEERKSKNQSE